MTDIEDIWEQLKAPKGKFRVAGYDKFEIPGEGYFIVGDYGTLEQAVKIAYRRNMEDAFVATSPDIATKYCVYDDQGNYRGGDLYKENEQKRKSYFMYN